MFIGGNGAVCVGRTLGDGVDGLCSLFVVIGSALPNCSASSTNAWRPGSPADSDGAVVLEGFERMVMMSDAACRK